MFRKIKINQYKLPRNVKYNLFENDVRQPLLFNAYKFLIILINLDRSVSIPLQYLHILSPHANYRDTVVNLAKLEEYGYIKTTKYIVKIGNSNYATYDIRCFNEQGQEI